MHGITAGVEVVAHRGASAYRAEHTRAAYEVALDQGAHVLELDVRPTADGELVVIHDPTLLRTAGRPERVADLSLEGIRTLCGPAAPPTLDDVLATFGHGARYLVELKDPTPAWEMSVVECVARHGLADRVTLQSFDVPSLERIGAGPWSPAVAPLFVQRPRTAALDAIAAYASGVGVWHRKVDAGFVAAAHARGLAVRAWTVNGRRAIRRVLRAGVDGVITDAPDVAAAVIDRAGAVARAA